MSPETELKEYKVKLPIINTSISNVTYILQYNDSQKYNAGGNKIPDKWSDINSVRINDVAMESIISKWKEDIATHRPNFYRIVKRTEEVIFIIK